MSCLGATVGYSLADIDYIWEGDRVGAARHLTFILLWTLRCRRTDRLEALDAFTGLALLRRTDLEVFRVGFQAGLEQYNRTGRQLKPKLAAVSVEQAHQLLSRHKLTWDSSPQPKYE